MPVRIEPCLALLAAKPPAGPDWAFEIKWDGYRLALHKEPAGIRIITRGGHDWTHRFPAIAEALILPQFGVESRPQHQERTGEFFAAKAMKQTSAPGERLTVMRLLLGAKILIVASGF